MKYMTQDRNNIKVDLTLSGNWVAQSVKRLTLGFGSGHDLTVHEFEPCVGSALTSVEPAWDFSLLLSLPLPSLLSLSFKINKET